MIPLHPSSPIRPPRDETVKYSSYKYVYAHNVRISKIPSSSRFLLFQPVENIIPAIFFLSFFPLKFELQTLLDSLFVLTGIE